MTVHKRQRIYTVGALGLLVGLGATRAGADIVGGTIVNASTGNFTLTSLTVNRGGASGTLTYTPNQLIGVNVTDIAATGTSVATIAGAPVPAAGSRADLLEDNRIDTGLINPFSTGAAADQSFEVTFTSPVVNGEGDDLVILELGGGDPTRFWVFNDRVNHHLDVSQFSFDTNLFTGVAFTGYTYDNPGGGTNVDGLAALESTTGWDGAGNGGSSAIAGLGLDLTALGVAQGATVSSLRYQTTDTGHRLDAVFIAGLPVPEPTTLALVGIAGAGLLAKRRVGGA